MKIVLDAFGGDNAPLAPLQAAARAVRELGVELLLAGDAAALCELAEKESIPLEGITLIDAPQALPMEAEAKSVLKEYAHSSMTVGLRLLAEGKADAFVSAGSTGALLMGATLIVKRIPGVRRPAIATLVPNKQGTFLLIDSGANSDVRPEMLSQFAVMGSVYLETVGDVQSPRVGLVNIGVEEHKGSQLYQEAYARLKNTPVNFIGNVEAREVPLGGCDVAVCDGFTGNVMLKLSEGLASFFMGELKRMFYGSSKGKLSALLLKNSLYAFKNRLDTEQYGGAPLLGVTKPVIKAHGNSSALALVSAVRQAKLCCENSMVEKIAAGIAALKNEGGDEQ